MKLSGCHNILERVHLLNILKSLYLLHVLRQSARHGAFESNIPLKTTRNSIRCLKNVKSFTLSVCDPLRSRMV